MGERQDRLKDLLSKINKKYGKNTVGLGDSAITDDQRISTGSFSLDHAMGGGVPRGRVTSFWGDSSSAKTTTSMRVAASLQKLCMNCFTALDGEINVLTGDRVRDKCLCKDMRKGVAAFNDIEGTFDKEWAKCVDLNVDELVYSRPETGEEAVDITEALLRSGDVDFVIFDSIAACAPIEEVEKSTEDAVVGKHAILMNKAWRIWNAAQNDVTNKTGMRPSLIAINQLRYKIGVMFGDPSTRPGGNGQYFASSIEVKMHRAKHEKEKKDKDTGEVTHEKPWVLCSGRVNKNKTARANLEYEFHMAVADFEEKELVFKKGEIIECKRVLKLAESYGLMGKKDDGGYFYKDFEFKKQSDLYDKMIYTNAGLAMVKRDLLKVMGG